MIFIYNRDEIQVDVLDIEPKFTEEISKLNTLEFETYAKLEKGYRVVYKQDGKPYEFIIIDSDYVRNDDVLFTYFCQDSLTELNAFPILDKRPQGSYKQALTSAFENTRWQLVFSADFSEAYTQNNSFYHISVLEAFSKVAEDYNIEWHTEYTYSDSKITGRKLVISKLGAQSNSRLEFGKNIKQFSRKISSEPIFTALYGYGKGEETETGGYGRRISFADINGGLAYVTNEEARLKYGVGPVGAKKHIFGFFIDEEETDKTKLLESTRKELERVSQPQAEYTIEAVNLHIDCGIGDTVPIIDDELGFRGNTRIIKVVTQGDSKEFTFGQVQKAFTDSFTKEIQKSAEATEIKITSIMETRLNQIADVYFGEDGYNYDLKVGNEYGLPAGLYSFDAPIDENPTKVVYMGAGKVMIADGKGSDGSWKWKTALDGNGIYGSEIITHSITANKLAADVGQSLDLSSNTSIKLQVTNTTKEYIDANKDQLKGEDGKDGASGKSAYEIAKANGFTGSEAEWINSLKAEPPEIEIKNNNWYIDGVNTNINAQGKDGHTPIIGIEDGYWTIDGVKTTTKALGKDGTDADIWNQGTDGYWYVNGVKTSQKWKGDDGKPADTWTQGEDGYWYVNGQITSNKWKGEDGGFIKGDEAPTDTTKIWFDTTDRLFKSYTDGKWEPIPNDELLEKISGINVQLTEYGTSIEALTQEISLQVEKTEITSESIRQVETKLKVLEDGVETNFSSYLEQIENNEKQIKELKGFMRSGLDDDGNVYTEWHSDPSADSYATFGTKGIALISAGEETFTVEDGVASATSLFVKDKIGYGNHTAQKYGTSFTIFTLNQGGVS